MHAWPDYFLFPYMGKKHYDVSSLFFVAMDFLCFESCSDGASVDVKIGFRATSKYLYSILDCHYFIFWHNGDVQQGRWEPM
jgi:hypothetical protein